MANSYSKIYIHLVFSVAYRDALIYEPFREELYKYITGGIKAQGHLLIAIGGMSDHIHILIRYNDDGTFCIYGRTMPKIRYNAVFTPGGHTK